MKRILFPTDLSEMTQHALTHAVHLAKITEAELLLVNAFTLEYFDSRIPRESYEMERDESKQKLDELKEDILEKPGNEKLNVRTSAIFGSPVNSIDEAAEHFDVDLLVMATNGVSSLKEFFSGSHTQRVIDDVDRPVLVIPEGLDFKSYDNILFASDLTHIPDKHLQVMSDIAKASEAKVHIVNVGPRERKEVMEKAAGRLEKEQLSDEVEHHWEFVENENVLEGLESYIDSHPEIDMLAMVGHERRDWLERFVSPRLTKRVVHHPLSCIIETGAQRRSIK
jgi:nucleotide-binding universal stress UspA family protein